MQHRSIAIILYALVTLTITMGSVSQASAAEHPNLLFVFADDQCWDTIRSLGNEEVETPNLDRLAKRGVSFSHAYNMGSWSGAVCVASRTMLNTGRFLWNAERVYKTSESEREAGRWWSELLKGAGYETYMTGKWHVRADAEKAFDYARHVRPGMPNQTPQGYDRPRADQEDPWKPWDPQFGGYWEGGTHWSEIVGNDAVEFLQQSGERDTPFFMYLAFNAPHDPRQSPQKYVAKYPVEDIKIPVNFVPEYPFQNDIGCGPRLRDEKLAPFPRTEDAIRVHRQEYYAIITHMDHQIGRILDALEATGKADQTYIFFTADHGLAVGQHGLLGKQNLFDHSVRVPLIVAGPGIPNGERIDGTVYLQDVMPSTLELAGVARPEHVQFRSLLPVIRGERQRNYDAVYGAYLQVQRMVTEDGFKLVLYPKIRKCLLFDLAQDPHEMRDLAGKERYRDTTRKLFAKLLELQQATGDELDLRSVYPELTASASGGSSN